MSISHQFAIMSLHGGQKYYHEVCANYLSHSAISSIVSGKGSRSQGFFRGPMGYYKYEESFCLFIFLKGENSSITSFSLLFLLYVYTFMIFRPIT